MSSLQSLPLSTTSVEGPSDTRHDLESEQNPVADSSFESRTSEEDTEQGSFLAAGFGLLILPRRLPKQRPNERSWGTSAYLGINH